MNCLWSWAKQNHWQDNLTLKTLHFFHSKWPPQSLCWLLRPFSSNLEFVFITCLKRQTLKQQVTFVNSQQYNVEKTSTVQPQWFTMYPKCLTRGERCLYSVRIQIYKIKYPFRFVLLMLSKIEYARGSSVWDQVLVLSCYLTALYFF